MGQRLRGGKPTMSLLRMGRRFELGQKRLTRAV
ncbi:MAG: hypothetical protein RLZZ618_1523 [Pseudomonadota bacterium]|jgi:hypothetical protein